MLELWNKVALGAGDATLGWLLALPRDLVLVLVGVGSAALIVLVRPWLTDQDLLKRVAADKERLSGRMKEAKRAGDAETLARLRRVNAKVGGKTLRAEMKPLAVVLLPLLIFATWAASRLEVHPPRAGEPVELVLEAPVSAAGTVAHIVPAEGLAAPGGWVRAVEAVEGSDPPHARAVWTLAGEARDVPYDVTVRATPGTARHPLRVGGRMYEPPRVAHDGFATEVRLRPVKLFGVVPGLPWVGLAPWLVAYILVVVPAYFGLRRLLGIA